MAKELNEDTTFKMSIKTMGMIAAGIAVVVGGWYSLMQEIQEAKETPVSVTIEEVLEQIPESEITRMEFDMKDQMIRNTILTTQKDVEEIKKSLEKEFSVKVKKVNTLFTTNGEKKAYVSLSKDTPAIDVATQLGLM